MFIREKQSHRQRYLVLVCAYRDDEDEGKTKQSTIYLGKSFEGCDWDSILLRIQARLLSADQLDNAEFESGRSLSHAVKIYLRQHSRSVNEAASLWTRLEGIRRP